MQLTVCCTAWLSSVQLCGRPTMISHPASRYWLGVLEAYTKAGREVTDCVLQRTLSLQSTQEGRQNFLGQEMETTTRLGVYDLTHWSAKSNLKAKLWGLEQRGKREIVAVCLVIFLPLTLTSPYYTLCLNSCAHVVQIITFYLIGHKLFSLSYLIISRCPVDVEG